MKHDKETINRRFGKYISLLVLAILFGTLFGRMTERDAAVYAKAATTATSKSSKTAVAAISKASKAATTSTSSKTTNTTRTTDSTKPVKSSESSETSEFSDSPASYTSERAAQDDRDWYTVRIEALEEASKLEVTDKDGNALSPASVIIYVSESQLFIENSNEVHLRAPKTNAALTKTELNRLITDGTIAKVTAEELGLVKKGEANSSDYYYSIPSGYQVASGAGENAMQLLVCGLVTKETIDVDSQYLWKKIAVKDTAGATSDQYTELTKKTTSEEGSIAFYYPYTIKQDEFSETKEVTFGCDWAINAIYVEKYTSSTLYKGEELVGTTLKNSNFTVMVTLVSGDTVRLPDHEFTLDSDTLPTTSGTKKLTISYVKNPMVNTTYSMGVTLYKIRSISASCTKEYHVGDTISLSDITVRAELYNVNTGGTTSSTVKSNEFTINAEKITNNGMNVITVSYEGLTCIVQIQGYGIEKLTATYNGKEIVVGGAFDKKDVKVSAIYTDGKTVVLNEEKDAYTFAGSQYITHEGVNEFTVIYGAYTATFTVDGVARAITKLEAKYIGEGVIVGGMFQNSDIQLNAIYNDGTKERIYNFLVSTNVVQKKGSNTITITYEGMTTTVTIIGVDKTATSITAIYHGEPIIEGNEINPNDIKVTAFYNDGSYGDVTDFSLSMTLLTGVGMNTITITYQKVTTSIYVICTTRLVKALEAVYKGPEVEQGSSFNRDYVLVTATFNDGDIEPITDFLLPSTLVSNIGTNHYTLTYNGASASFTVVGVAKTITGKGTMQADISNDQYEGITLTAVVEGELIKETMELGVEVYEQNELKRIVRKTTKKGQYIGFEVDVDGFQFVDNQFMTARITIPTGFDPTKVAVFYTPNRKSVMAKLGGGLIDSNTYEFYIYYSGTYVLLECNENVLKEADLRRTETIAPFICVSGLKPQITVGEKLNLSATVLHALDSTNTELIWSVDDSSIAKVTSNGVLLGKDEGTVTLTVKSKDGKLSYTCEVEVIEKEE